MNQMARPSPTGETRSNAISSSAIVALFNDTFVLENTILQGGAHEPFFRPATTGKPAVIYFRADYLRSALHEVAHWCVAGKARRRLADYGYWYSPDDRDEHQQAAFFAVEARPQALESLFCNALGIRFAPSIDNLSLSIKRDQLANFERRIEQARGRFLAVGMPARAKVFLTAAAAIPG